MKIGIIGAGHIGANAARLFVEAGHDVAIANSRGAETLRQLIHELGERAQAVSAVEAAGFGEIVFVSIPFGKYRELPAAALSGKIVVDSNNYYPERDGNYSELDDGKTSSSEMLAEFLKDAKIVKAFNTIWFEHLKTQGNKDLPVEERRAIFIAGDHREAKDSVVKLIEDIGFAAVDTGELADGASQQPGTAIYNRNLTAHEAEAILGSEGY